MFARWDIVFAPKFPDTYPCNHCLNHYSILEVQCTHCGKPNNVSNIVAKKRPIIVWVGQTNWFDSMAFGIPTSSSSLRSDRGNEMILLPEYHFQHQNQSYHRPMRAIIAQATRFDGNVLSTGQLIGRVTDAVLQKKIEDKLFAWIFAG